MNRVILVLFLYITVFKLQLCMAQADLESVPSTWTAAKGTLSADTNHYRLGNKSVAWNWVGNDTLKVTGIKFNPSLIGNGSSLDFSMYNTSMSPTDSVIIQFYDKKKRFRYYFSVHLNYKGWYDVVRNYNGKYGGTMYKPKNAPTTSDSITTAYIIAPKQGSGQLNFDDVNWINGTGAVTMGLPMHDSLLKQRGLNGSFPLYDDYTIYNLPPNVDKHTPTASEIADFMAVKTSFMKDIYAYYKANPADLASANNYFDSLGFSLNSDGTAKGKAIKGFFSPIGAYVDFNSNFKCFACSWYQNNDTVSFNKAIIMLRYLLDNGNFAGGAYRLGTYDSPNFYTGLLLMADTLYTIDTTLYNDLTNYVKWDLDFGAAWMPPNVYSPLSTDNPKEQMTGYMGYPLGLIRDTATAIQNLRGFNQFISIFMTPTDGLEDNIKVDGSCFHHLANYWGYTQSLYTSFAQYLYHLHDTQFKPDSVTYKRIRDEIYNFFLEENLFNTSYGNNMDVGPGWFARYGFNQYLSRFAHLGNGITGNGPDYLLACAYNRLFPTMKDTSLPVKKFPAEPFPSGFTQLNYATMGLYRKPNWLATIKMLSPDFWGVQCGMLSAPPRRDVFGRYRPYGSIDVIYPSNPYYSTSSPGYTSDLWTYTNGYDHLHPNGTTTILLNLDSLASNQYDSDEYAYTGSLAGSLSFHNRVKNFSFKTRGDYGLSAMKFQQAPFGFHQNAVRSPKRDTTFKFQKSWFAFDSIIVCLGSGIKNKNSVNKTATNLFQLTDSAQTIYINGVANSSFPYKLDLIGTGPYQIISPNYNGVGSTGFYVRSNDSLHISVSNQQFALRVNNQGGDTIYNSVGNWANVWLDHGTAPVNKGYEYVMIPSTTSKYLKAFSTKMSNPATAYYTVKQADSAMHYVYYKPKNIQGYAIFQAISNIGDSSSMLKSVNKPCYAMGIKQGDSLLNMTVVNPSPNLQQSNTISSFFPPQLISYSIQTNLNVTVRGRWNIAAADSEISILGKTDTTTTLQVLTQYALPYDMALKKDTSVLLDIKHVEIPYLHPVDKSTESLMVYPNPVAENGQLKIHYQSIQERKNVTLEIFSEDGKRVFADRFTAIHGDNMLSIPSAKLGKGLFVAKLSSETTMPLFSRFIVK